MLSQRLMLMPSMDTMVMDMPLVMPTTDMNTMDTHMPTMDLLTTARDLLMLSQRLMLMLYMPTMARDLLMLRPMLMLTTDTHTVMPTMDMDMPTADTTDTHTLTDRESKMLTKS